MKKFIPFYILLMLIVGCTQLSATDVGSTDETLATKVQPSQWVTDTLDISAPVSTLAPTPQVSTATTTVIVILTSTPSPTSTATPTPPPVQLIHQCLPLTSPLPSDSSYNGRIAFAKSVPPFSSAFLLDLATGQRIDLPTNPDEDIYIASVSPDQQKLAYIREPTIPAGAAGRKLIIADYNGRTQQTLPFQPSWIASLGWLNSNYYVLHSQGPDEYLDEVTVLNLLTGEAQSYSPEMFPSMYYVTPGPWGLMYHPPIVFAPTYAHLVYCKVMSGELGLSIWDLNTNQEINFISRTLDVAPIWSPDGQQVLTVKNSSPSSAGTNMQELFLIPLEGPAQRITYLTSFYKQVHLSDPSWSSDQRYIAFGIKASPYAQTEDYPADGEEKYHLAILDLQLSEIHEYCVPYYGNMSPPIWSPDNRYLLVWDTLAWDQEWVYLVDLQKGITTKIIDGFRPVGWLVDERRNNP